LSSELIAELIIEFKWQFVARDSLLGKHIVVLLLIVSLFESYSPFPFKSPKTETTNPPLVQSVEEVSSIKSE
jgi:hypothetical protein